MKVDVRDMQFNNKATINTDEAAGVKFDGNKPMMQLIPAEAELAEAAVWTFGAQKYEEDNWKKGLDYRRIVGAAQRHLTAIKMGEFIDPESGLPHAAHVRCCMAMLIYFGARGRVELDNISLGD